MTKQEYDDEMLRAKTLSQDEPDKADYYYGYVRGLRKAYNGGGFGVDAEHNRLLNLIYKSNARQHARGEGYRDGLKAVA